MLTLHSPSTPARPSSTVNTSIPSPSPANSSPRPDSSLPDSPNPSPNNPKTSTNGKCGAFENATCLGTGYGPCCSQFGWCGHSSLHCGKRCQMQFGNCGEVEEVALEHETDYVFDGTGDAAPSTGTVNAGSSESAFTSASASASASSSERESVSMPTFPSTTAARDWDAGKTTLVKSPSAHVGIKPGKTGRLKSLKEILEEHYGKGAYEYLGGPDEGRGMDVGW
ncbi:carbohydrate-binding module family 18 protein [Lentithecium fluviatile CBS 122367]|uniref:Carbohydrate-binding module family 18 protein n=1 Tax=Lentithecium fluviatile CBS 122367 TaxID=1168545 RepID=A0A6G1INL5_9PLEO|nr:carbohydrate-binding module family 18 protein [Lentithecium fluviatile CBS 122367]